MALVARIADGVRIAAGDDLGLDEQRMLEGRLRGLALVGRVVRIHEQEGAGLQFAVHAARGFVHQGARARSGDEGDGQARRLDGVARGAGGFHGGGDGIAPFGRASQVLGPAMVGMQAGEVQPCMAGDRLRERHRRLARRHAAAALADVDLDEHVDPGAVRAGRVHGFGQAGDALRAVHGDGEAPAACGELLRQACHAQQLGRRDHLVADVDVRHAAGGERLGLRDLLHAGAAGTGLLQAQRQLGALVHLRVGAPAHLVLAREIGHALDVALHGVEVHDRGRGVDQVHPLADGGEQRRGGIKHGFHRGRRPRGVACRPSPPG